MSKKPTSSGNNVILIISRHAARLDYETRDAGSNYTKNSPRPQDTPLSSEGFQQALALGDKIHSLLKEHGLQTSVRDFHVYSSPLLRCCQTAAGAVKRLSEIRNSGDLDEPQPQERSKSDDETKETKPILEGTKLKIEHGLIESLCPSWYTSWCLPDSDSTWGFHKKLGLGCGPHKRDVHPDDIKKLSGSVHSYAKACVTEALLCHDEILQQDGMYGIQIDQGYKNCYTLNDQGYKWGNFEPRDETYNRMEYVAKTLTRKHAEDGGNCVVLCVSHGGPTTHLYERLSGADWETHGICGYTGTSLYAYKGEDTFDVITYNR